MYKNVILDPELIHRYDTVGPRYTSYPTAVNFNNTISVNSYRQQVAISNQRGGPLSLYLHLPFCDTVCFFCACNKIITKNRDHTDPYLANLHKEIELQAAELNSDRVVEQLHWGGGTPTFISHDQMRKLMAITRRYFKLADNSSGEFSIEVDPREASADTIAILAEIGFNRLSLGIQDFNPIVQRAINRIQGERETLTVINAAHKNGFRSISLDLIYGLPNQTTTSFDETLKKVISIDPDRLSIFNYAHMPESFKTQRQIQSEDIPSAEIKLEILQQSIETLTQAGYIYIGMDHFAKPDDELAIAQRDNKLYRNFQGYSTHSDCDLIGLGITSIGRVGDSYSQNQKRLDQYDLCLKTGKLPVFRGITLDEDDKIRRTVINSLICHFSLDIIAVERELNINFTDYFSNELFTLQQFVYDGLLNISSSSIDVLPAGFLLIRNICMVFDSYIKRRNINNFSKVI